MRLFNRTKPETQQEEVARHELSHDSGVQVVVHKNAAKQTIEKANQVNDHLKDLLVENGFTLKIYLAAGGQPSRKQTKRKAA